MSDFYYISKYRSVDSVECGLQIFSLRYDVPDVVVKSVKRKSINLTIGIDLFYSRVVV